MPTDPDIQPPRDQGLWMNPRLWRTLPNTNIEGPNCRRSALWAHVWDKIADGAR